MNENPYRRESSYAERYRDQRFATGHGPRTDQRERQAVRTLLTAAPSQAGPWLDMPSGAGRMSAELPGPVLQIDRNPQMLRASSAAGDRVCGSALALPLADNSCAGVLCCRLLQHLGVRADRLRVLSEIRRVSRGSVILSFFDAHSLLHLRRTLRRALGKNRSGRSAISRRQLRLDLAEAGLEPVRWLPLQRFVAEQTFVLCRDCN